MTQNTAHRLRTRCGPYADEIMQLTGLSKDAIAHFIYKLGVQWLQAHGLQRLARRRDFWRDFCHHWYAQDFQFLILEERQTAKRYRMFHRNALKTFTLNINRYE